jgi:hypothetical protein
MHTITLVIFLPVLLMVSSQLPNSFDKLIPNGILISESSDNVFMCKHTWRVFVSVRKPVTPRGYRSQADKILKLINSAYNKNDKSASMISKYEKDNRILKIIHALRIFKVVNRPVEYANTHNKKNTKKNKKPNKKSKKKGKSREKRGLFNFIGRGLQSLFGVATENDVMEVKRLLAFTYTGQKQVRHNVNNLTTVVNRMQYDIRFSRRALNVNINNVNRLFAFQYNINSTISLILNDLRRKDFLRIIDNLISDFSAVTHRFKHLMELYSRRRTSLENGRLSHDLMPLSYLNEIERSLNKTWYLITPKEWYCQFSTLIALDLQGDLLYRVDLCIIDNMNYIEYAINCFAEPVKGTNSTLKMRIESPHVTLETSTGLFSNPRDCVGINPRVCRSNIYLKPDLMPCIASVILQKKYNLCAIQITQTSDKQSIVYEFTGKHFVVCTFGENLEIFCKKRATQYHYLTPGCHILFPDNCIVESSGWKILSIGITTSYITLKTPNLVLNELNISDILNISRLMNFKIKHSDVQQLEQTRIVHLETLPVMELDMGDIDSGFMRLISDIINYVVDGLVICMLFYYMWSKRHQVMRCLKSCKARTKKNSNENQTDESCGDIDKSSSDLAERDFGRALDIKAKTDRMDYDVPLEDNFVKVNSTDIPKLYPKLSVESTKVHSKRQCVKKSVRPDHLCIPEGSYSDSYELHDMRPKSTKYIQTLN